MIMDSINYQNGELHIGGKKVTSIVRKHQTPIIIYDENKIVANIQAYKNALAKYYPHDSLVAYASKAFCCRKMMGIAKNEGIGVDVVSGGEMATAALGDVPGDKVYFHGNYKSDEEIELGIEHGIHAFVVDGKDELESLNRLAKFSERRINVLLRVRPGVEAHTHEFVQTGQVDSKFGVAIANGEADETIIEIKKCPYLNLIGLHCHIGSQIFGSDAFEVAIGRIVEFAASMKEHHDVELKELNVGGGVGIKYVEADKPMPIDKFIKNVSNALVNACEKYEIKFPKLIVEPGRSIVGNAAITVYTVVAIKDIPGVRKYIIVDGGMVDNPRFALYGSEYEAVLVNETDGKKERVTVAGRCCESGDIVIKDILLPKVSKGDLLAVECTGAYNYSMASHYNRLPKPSVIFVANGEDKVAITRETYEFITACDRA